MEPNFESTPTFWLKFCYSNSSFILQFKIIVDNFKYRYWYWYEVWHISYQCCGAGADRSRGFWVGAGADLKFNLEPEPIYWIGSGLFFLAREKRNDLKMFIFLSAVRSEVDWTKACAASSRILYITKMCIVTSCFSEASEPRFSGCSRSRKKLQCQFFYIFTFTAEGKFGSETSKTRSRPKWKFLHLLIKACLPPLIIPGLCEPKLIEYRY